MSRTVVIAGFFPPPVTGQALATARLGELLEPTHKVVCVNLRDGDDAIDFRVATRFVQKFTAYRKAGKKLADVLRQNPGATLVWTAISPEKFGHWRDLLAIVPTFELATRTIAVVHWGRFSKLFRSGFTAASAKWMIRDLDAVVFLNDDRANDCASWISAEKRKVIPNTLDVSVVCTDDEVENKQAASRRGGPLQVLFLSHMLREKGYLDVLAGVRIAKERGVDVRVTFAGQWINESDRAAFARSIEDGGLVEQVDQIGPVFDRERVKALHLMSNVFVLPSYMIEGQPLAIIEAMNAGSPVVTTNIGGMVGMITSGKEGYLVDQQSPEAIADALQHLADPETWLQQSRAARSRYLAEYSPDTVQEQWRQLV